MKDFWWGFGFGLAIASNFLFIYYDKRLGEWNHHEGRKWGWRPWDNK